MRIEDKFQNEDNLDLFFGTNFIRNGIIITMLFKKAFFLTTYSPDGTEPFSVKYGK